MKIKQSILCALIISVAVLTACSGNSPVQKATNPPESATPNSNTPAQTPAPTQTPNNVASVGETLEKNGIQITFDKVENYTDTSEYAFDKAEEGKEFVLLWFTVKNTTENDYHVNLFYEDSYCDDIAIDPATILINAPKDTLWGDVAAGKSKIGYVGYALPHDWESIEFQYKPVFSGQESKLIFKANKGDI